ncbi:Fic family protein [Prevotella communis]|uniref:Fic family protein n=1 Tax=Prevotella communis TaxID=2913614 RepID=A0A1H0L5T2_9BACT|nr:Fic family protein [Prevotella communis]SDO63442.1 Fic family protein [Prevotella communis]
MYIHEKDNWTDFHWDTSQVSLLQEDVFRKQGLLYGRLGSLGFDSKLKAMAENLTHDVVYSSEIEGIKLNVDQVRSSIARRLGIENVKYTAPSHYVDSVVNVMLDAVQHYDQPLCKEKLCAWQAAFFPTGFSEGSQIEIGQYRTNEEHIVSGLFGREKIHYIAPSPDRVEEEMQKFLTWFDNQDSVSSVIRSAIAHFWFVSIHPFEDGNGRLARILSDMLLARGEKSEFRFYNVSSQINKDKNHYYDILERMQHGDGDITEWLVWYMQKLVDALDEAETIVTTILNKSFFWQKASSVPMTERQTQMLNLFLDGYEAKITSKTWASLAKCSKDTAIRDIQDLVEKNILIEDIPGAKRPSYSIVCDTEDLSQFFTDVNIVEENGIPYLKAMYKGRKPVSERILKLDAERYQKGDLPLTNLLNKYCSYITQNN